MRLLAILPVALSLLASLAPAQGHNGTRAWKASQFLAVLGGPSEAFLVFRGAAGVDLVAARSLLLVGDQLVVSTRAAIETRLVGGPVPLALVTHGDEALHLKCLDELFDGPLPAAMAIAATQLSTYYVDASWQVHKVTTDRQGKETPLAHARRHKGNLEEYQRLFPCDKEKTQLFALAKAGNADAVSSGK